MDKKDIEYSTFYSWKRAGQSGVCWFELDGSCNLINTAHHDWDVIKIHRMAIDSYNLVKLKP